MGTVKVLCVATLIQCVGCVAMWPIPRSVVVGHYFYDGRNTDILHGAEELTLNEDGTFVQQYYPPNGGTVRSFNARWTYNESEKRVHFTDLHTWEDRDLLGFPAKPNTPTSYDFPVAIYGDAVHIELYFDLATSFKKHLK